MFQISNTYNSFDNGSFGPHAVLGGVSGAAKRQGGESHHCTIGQYRIINSSFQEPRMAEVVQLYDNSVDTYCVYGEENAGQGVIRRVGPGGHLPDPYLTPVGGVPDVLMVILIVGYIFLKKLRKRSIVTAGKVR